MVLLISDCVISHTDKARESQVSAHRACCQVVHMSQSYCETSAKKPKLDRPDERQVHPIEKDGVE